MNYELLKIMADGLRMSAAEIDAQPDDREWAMEEIDALEELQSQALQLAQNIEALLGGIGGAPSDDAGSWHEYQNRVRK